MQEESKLKTRDFSEDLSDLILLSEKDASIAASQMLSILNTMKDEKALTDSMINFLNEQSTIQRVLYSITGHRRIVKKEIAKHKDRIVECLMQAVSMLYYNQLKESNTVKQILICFYDELSASKRIMSDMKEKLDSVSKDVDFLMLTKHIEDGIYSSDNFISSLLCILSQTDEHILCDSKKNSLLSSMRKAGALPEGKLSLKEYMMLTADIPDEKLGDVRTELLCLSGDPVAEMMESVTDRYNCLEAGLRDMTEKESIVSEVLSEKHIKPDLSFTAEEIYERFVNEKAEYLGRVSEIRLVTAAPADENKEEPEEKSDGLTADQDAAALLSKNILTVYKYDTQYRFAATAVYINKVLLELRERYGIKNAELPGLADSEMLKQEPKKYGGSEASMTIFVGDEIKIKCNGKKEDMHKTFFRQKELWIRCQNSDNPSAVSFKTTPMIYNSLDDTFAAAAELCQRYSLPVFDDLFCGAVKATHRSELTAFCRNKFNADADDPDMWLVISLLGDLNFTIKPGNKIEYSNLQNNAITESLRLLIAFYKWLEYKGLLKAFEK